MAGLRSSGFLLVLLASLLLVTASGAAGDVCAAAPEEEEDVPTPPLEGLVDDGDLGLGDHSLSLLQVRVGRFKGVSAAGVMAAPDTASQELQDHMSSRSPSPSALAAVVSLEAASQPQPIEVARFGVRSLMIVAGAVFLIFLLAVTLQVLARNSDQQSTFLKKEWLDLGTSFLVLVVTLCGYGFLQEYIMTQEYPGGLFPSAVFLILANRVLIVVFAVSMLMARGECRITPATKWLFLPAGFVFMSSWCQNSSLRFVSFPTQVVFKSARIVPTMIVNTIMVGKKHGIPDYVFAMFITACVFGFTMGAGSDDPAVKDTTVGVAMLIAYLVFDALTSNSEKRIYNEYPDLNNLQMLLGLAVFTLFYSVVVEEADGGFEAVFRFLAVSPTASAHVFALSVCSTGSQYIMLHIIQQHGPVAYSIMMTVRHLFSVVLSVMFFNHPLPKSASYCAAAIFLALLLKPFILKPQHDHKRPPAAAAAHLTDGERTRDLADTAKKPVA